ncbi:hypothetical protein Skr01_63860 [Sphaerisporangium krabiense]|uniref:Phosphopantetheinyl transferase n=1 Tax=Sphaerisporangium krabiense TaxID=763782 RepID=A0A7W8Z6D3_9ACTN|nr:4'-phosphopantetheinyl transferase superfamily protein [Sphaerisporangium krabiense]MBB5628304.1 phosphopantetheinyl transferase [Sphaerisporangium krabiense]GII66301.1 hypothetical protein Skr01_63860 [Sphaerisporangium krabiense]
MTTPTRPALATTARTKRKEDATTACLTPGAADRPNRTENVTTTTCLTPGAVGRPKRTEDVTTDLVVVRPGVWVACAVIGLEPGGGPAGGTRFHTADDLRQAGGMHARRRREFLAGRALLRLLLGAAAPAVRHAEVRAGPRGRPMLAGHPWVGVSVSHDQGLVAAAVAPHRRVGVDVQRPATASSRMVGRIFGRHAGLVRELPAADQEAAVAWAWTAQEACAKADGRGLAARPWRIEVPPEAETGAWGPYRWTSLRAVSAIPLSYALGPPHAPHPLPPIPYRAPHPLPPIPYRAPHPLPPIPPHAPSPLAAHSTAQPSPHPSSATGSRSCTPSTPRIPVSLSSAVRGGFDDGKDGA